jgi:hypothetical protein
LVSHRTAGFHHFAVGEAADDLLKFRECRPIMSLDREFGRQNVVRFGAYASSASSSGSFNRSSRSARLSPFLGSRKVGLMGVSSNDEARVSAM